MRLRVLLLLAGLAPLLAACGDRDEQGPFDADHDAAMVFELRLDLAEARRMGRVSAGEADLDVTTECAAAIGRRADAGGWERCRADVVGPGRVRLIVDAAEKPDKAALALLLKELGLLQFRIEVLSPAQAAARQDPDSPAPARSIWTGSNAEYLEYKAAEVARALAARTAGSPYKPSRPGLFVAPARGQELAADPAHWHVLEMPAAQDRFDGEALRNPVQTWSLGIVMPVVVFTVAAERQEDMARWTTANIGLPLAIVLDGSVSSSPVINDTLRDTIQINPGAGDRQESQELVQVIAAGALRVRVEIESATLRAAP